MVYEYRYDMHVVQYLVMSCSSAWGSTTVVIRALMIHRECLVPVKIRPRSKKSRNPMLDISKSSRTQLEGNYWAIIETKCEQTLLRTEDRQATGKRSNLSQWKTALDPYCCRIVSQHHSITANSSINISASLICLNINDIRTPRMDVCTSSVYTYQREKAKNRYTSVLLSHL